MEYQCAREMYLDLYHPICPQWFHNPGYYCLGEETCMNNPEFCDCEAGEKYCNEGFNVCAPVCQVYIDGSDGYRSSINPKEMECSSEYGDVEDWDFYPYFYSSCCSNVGHYFVATGQSGGFDFGYERPDVDPSCEDYATKMSTILCSPDQGKYIENNTLRVCLSSCQTLFDECGLPGDNFPSWANYTDATSLCYEAWGGFGSDSPCESKPEGALCQNGVLNLEVVEGNDDCLGLPDKLPSWQFDGIQNTCGHSGIFSSSSGGSRWFSWAIYVILFIGCVVLDPIRKRYCKKQQQQEVSNGNNSENQDNVQGQGQTGTSSAESIPVASAVVEVPVANAVPAPIAATPIVTALPEPATSAQPSAPPADKDLTFDQTMDLQSLEFKLRMDAITQAEFEEMKKEILDR